MKFKLLLPILSFFFFVTTSFKETPIKPYEAQTIYDFTLYDIYGKEFNFESLRGKKVIIVNTASSCGLAEDQFKALEATYEKYSSKNLVVIAIPSNDFRETENKSNEEIIKCYLEEYNVSFPILAKISVTGKDTHELYKFLTDKNKTGIKGCGVLWNFQKYLINENGVLEKIVQPKTLITDPSIVAWLNK